MPPRLAPPPRATQPHPQTHPPHLREGGARREEDAVLTVDLRVLLPTCPSHTSPPTPPYTPPHPTPPPGRPEDLVVTHVAVPPVAIRPSVEMDGASNEDDITMKLMQVRVCFGGGGGRRGCGGRADTSPNYKKPS